MLNRRVGVIEIVVLRGVRRYAGIPDRIGAALQRCNARGVEFPIRYSASERSVTSFTNP